MKRGDARAARVAEEELRGPALLAAVRGRMVRNYGAYARHGLAAGLGIAKRDVWLLMREVERLVLADS
jgi:hypothetical protein